MKLLSGLFLAALLLLAAPAYGQPPLSDQLFEKATVQYLVGDLGGAGKNLRSLLKIDPKYPGAKQLLNSILREKGLKLPSVKQQLETKKTVEAKVSVEMLSLMTGVGGAVLIAGLILLIYNRVKTLRRRRTRLCFSCGAEISLNIDQCPNCGAWIGAKMQMEISRAQRDWYRKSGWKSNPFTLDIHPELFTGFRDEVKQILEKVASESGHILITAPLGAGKTTLLRWLTNQLVIDSLAVYIPRPPQDFSQLVKLIIEKMGVPQKEVVGYDIYHLQELRKRIGKPLIILMDEAHEFTLEIEKPLRTLGDLDDVKLIMAGLPETVEKFQNEIRPLFERLVLNIYLKPIDYGTFKELIKTRIEHFGGAGTSPFTADALEAIYVISGGIPRRVIKACDWAVTRAIGTGEDRINAHLLEDLKKQAVRLDQP
ncbi:MAG TPA: AAA family ATPase [Candidatus Sulfotelmatobacter sp.]|nr:AAA family ATPase [Candidatus Sulfotelmatobacter sp.]